MHFDPSIVCLILSVQSIFCLIYSHLYVAGNCWHHFSGVCSKLVDQVSSQSLVVVSTVDNAFSRVPVNPMISL